MPPPSLLNRLLSVRFDADWVSRLAGSPARYPLVPNERCGSWYVVGCDASSSAYFMSKDGHKGKWDFSLRRLNLHVASMAADKGGVLLIDSTSRGKRVPDSLSKTVPIWCAVLNRALALIAQREDWDTDLHVPWIAVDSEEQRAIEQRIDGFVEAFMDLGLDLGELAAKVRKPLRPVWVSPSHDVGYSDLLRQQGDLPYYPIVCVTASEFVDESTETVVKTIEVAAGDTVTFEYVAGGGDDHDSWSLGMTPQQFVKHGERVLVEALKTGERDCESLVRDLVAGTSSSIAVNEDGNKQELRINAGDIELSVSAHEPSSPPSLLIGCHLAPCADDTSRIHLGLAKVHTKLTRGDLVNAMRTVATEFSTRLPSLTHVHVLAAPSEPDSLGIALAFALVFLIQQRLLLLQEGEQQLASKPMISQCIAQLSAALPSVQIPRHLLKAVNSFFMSDIK